MSIIDETMSQDTAFDITNDKNDTFKFDIPDEKPVASDTTEKEVTPSQSGDSQEDDDSVENKIPYSRFKKKVDEVNEYASRVSYLEGQLAERQSRQESTSQEDVEIPQEWVELYGDSDVAKRAYKVQLAREEKLLEKATEDAYKALEQKEINERESLEENEGVIDESLEDLQAKIGKKLSPKQEEELLGIVDEFSPTGPDGKYVTLFPFDKAFEIMSLRNASKGNAVRQARQSVADLTNDTSEGEADAPSSNYKRGWDNWREEL